MHKKIASRSDECVLPLNFLSTKMCHNQCTFIKAKKKNTNSEVVHVISIEAQKLN